MEKLLDRPAPIGRLGPYRNEGIRLRPETSLAFPPSDVYRVEVPGEETYTEWCESVGGEDYAKLK